MQNNKKKNFNKKWLRKAKEYGMHLIKKENKEDFLEQLKKFNTDEEREEFLKQLYTSPQAKAERFGCVIWVIISIIILLIILL